MMHELWAPLYHVIGFTEFLVDGKPGPVNRKQKEYLEDVLDGLAVREHPVQGPQRSASSPILRTSVNPEYRTNGQFTGPVNRPLNAADAN
jgi:hypothetical protein